MRHIVPRYCRPEAFASLAAHLDGLETVEGLVHGAMAVAQHELPDADVSAVDIEIQTLADTIRSRVRSGQAEAILAHAHAVLFDELGFAGNTEDYYNPRNAYLPMVLETRRGLPVLLALIYKAVLENLGLRVHGINAPAHFLAGVEAEPGCKPILIDPFFGGRLLSPREALDQIESMTGAVEPETVLVVATHRQWIARVACNLESFFARADRYADVSAMIEIRMLLEE